MAFKPPPLGDVMQQVGGLVGPPGFVEEVDRNARALAQSALRRLDFVSRDEFDAQAAVLQRTQAKVAALESEVAALTEAIERLEAQTGGG